MFSVYYKSTKKHDRILNEKLIMQDTKEIGYTIWSTIVLVARKDEERLRKISVMMVGL
jgi:hypothetical protein